MNRPSPLAYRCVTIATLGAVLFFSYFRPFLPYSQRGQVSVNWWPFPVSALICGFLLSVGLARRRFWVPICFLLMLFVAQAVLIVIDTVTGAVDHNLFPLEFLFIAVLTLPAFVGASLAASVDWFRARGLRA